MVNWRRRLFIFGFGLSASTLARRLVPDFRVAGTYRSPEKRAALSTQGVESFLFGQDLRAALQGTTHILLSVPPNADGDPAFRLYGKNIVQLMPQLEWMGYLSTTGVYGDHAGGWVTEQTLVSPSTERGARRLAAEHAWQLLAREHGLPLHIFRLAGIYGPGRNQFAALRDGSARRVIKEGQVFSRIHVEDVAQVLAASIAHPRPGAIYNVCDDEPAPPQDVVAYAATLLGAPMPPDIAFERAELSPMARSFYAESKRVANKRLKEELGVKLLYPSYREGLRALLEQGE